MSILKKRKNREEEGVMRAATSEKGPGKPSLTFE